MATILSDPDYGDRTPQIAAAGLENVLGSSAAVTSYQSLGDLNDEQRLLTVSGGRRSKIKAPAGLLSNEDPVSSFTDVHLLPVFCGCGPRQAGHALCCLSCEGTNPVCEGSSQAPPLQRLRPLQQAPPPTGPAPDRPSHTIFQCSKIFMLLPVMVKGFSCSIPYCQSF